MSTHPRPTTEGQETTPPRGWRPPWPESRLPLERPLPPWVFVVTVLAGGLVATWLSAVTPDGLGRELIAAPGASPTWQPWLVVIGWFTLWTLFLVGVYPRLFSFLSRRLRASIDAARAVRLFLYAYIVSTVVLGALAALVISVTGSSGMASAYRLLSPLVYVGLVAWGVGAVSRTTYGVALVTTLVVFLVLSILGRVLTNALWAPFVAPTLLRLLGLA